VCTVAEQGTGSLPPGSTEFEVPPTADTTGVTIPSTGGAVVDVVDNLAADPVETGSVQLVKVLAPGAPPGVTLPAAYTAHASCDDGTETDVTLPGAGGNGAPVVTVPVLTDCLVTEDTTGLPTGWVVTYTVEGGTPTTTPPILTVASTAVVNVTITNDPTAVPTTTSPTTTPTSAVGSTVPGVAALPPTGGDTQTPLIVGFGLVAVGVAALGYTTRKRDETP
jgi:LPXTG-motif cell wall-anchored protein